MHSNVFECLDADLIRDVTPEVLQAPQGLMPMESGILAALSSLLPTIFDTHLPFLPIVFHLVVPHVD